MASVFPTPQVLRQIINQVAALAVATQIGESVVGPVAVEVGHGAVDRRQPVVAHRPPVLPAVTPPQHTHRQQLTARRVAEGPVGKPLDDRVVTDAAARADVPRPAQDHSPDERPFGVVIALQEGHKPGKSGDGFVLQPGEISLV